MQNLRLLLLILTGVLTACTSMEFREEFKPTASLIKETRAKCIQNIKNEPLARKECFPLLKDKKLLIKVLEISDSLGQLSVEGAAGPNRNRVTCEVDEETKAAIEKDPGSVVIGGRYWVKGEFTRFTAAAPLDFYTLSNCTIEPFQASQP